MAEDNGTTTGIARHGASRLPSVDVDSFNVELKDDNGFLGDRASKGAFRKILEQWRKPLRKSGKDPFGDEPSDKISKRLLDDVLGVLEKHGLEAHFDEGRIEVDAHWHKRIPR